MKSKKPVPVDTVNHLKHLVFDPQNARLHNPRNIGTIVVSLHEVGAARSIVIDENNVVLAGNGVVEAAGEAGIEKVRVVEADGNEVIAVRRRGLTELQKKRLALFDNRAAELAEWNPEELARLDKECPQMLEGMFHDDELCELLPEPSGAQEGDGGGGLLEPDAKAELQKKWGTKPGQLWQAGNHRILCGDSTKKEDVAKVLAGGKPALMVTDPPYGVEYDPSWRPVWGDKDIKTKAVSHKVANDDRASWASSFALFPGSVAYVWHDGVYSCATARSLEACSFDIRSQIIWVKQRFLISRGAYHWRHEPCYYAVREGCSANFIGNRKNNTVWGDIVDRFDAEGELYAARVDAETVLAFDGSVTTVWELPNDKPCGVGHPTQKPVECMARPIRNHEGDVYEPFAGSGSTVVAAEACGRRSYSIELDPGWLAGILERLSQLGLEPKQVAK
jgi:DNA modification methylase